MELTVDLSADQELVVEAEGNNAAVATSTDAPRVPAGTPLRIALPDDVFEDGYVFRVSVARDDEPTRVVYDYSPKRVYLWTPLDEGEYTITVSVKPEGGSLLASADITLQTTPITTDAPTAVDTAHPLVAHYAAPTCDGEQMRVEFRQVNSRAPFTTTPKECESGRSANFYVGGMLADTWYFMRHEVLDGHGTVIDRGPWVGYRTGSIPFDPPGRSVEIGPSSESSLQERLLIQSMLLSGESPPLSFATDMSGEVVWYYSLTLFPWRIGTYLTRPAGEGTFFYHVHDEMDGQLLREIDLVGNVVQETSARRISEQLVEMGQDRITGFHHEMVRLPTGKTYVLAGVLRQLTDEQGEGDVWVLGDMLIALDENLQVTWAWNAFDHLDTARESSLDEVCGVNICPPLLDFEDDGSFTVIDEANDWLHSNSIAYSPADGNLIVSVRNQDWVIKIDYRDGEGTGDILWRLGKEGDFDIVSDDPNPWFNHQHDVSYIDDDRIIVYDNNTVNCEANGSSGENCHSRGQVYHLDEENMVATLEVNADLGVYAKALGAAQQLRNGNYHFSSGGLMPDLDTLSDEVTASGEKTYSERTNGALYRSYRMVSLYEQ